MRALQGGGGASSLQPPQLPIFIPSTMSHPPNSQSDSPKAGKPGDHCPLATTSVPVAARVSSGSLQNIFKRQSHEEAPGGGRASLSGSEGPFSRASLAATFASSSGQRSIGGSGHALNQYAFMMSMGEQSMRGLRGSHRSASKLPGLSAMHQESGGQQSGQYRGFNNTGGSSNGAKRSSFDLQPGGPRPPSGL